MTSPTPELPASGATVALGVLGQALLAIGLFVFCLSAMGRFTLPGAGALAVLGLVVAGIAWVTSARTLGAAGVTAGISLILAPIIGLLALSLTAPRGIGGALLAILVGVGGLAAIVLLGEVAAARAWLRAGAARRDGLLALTGALHVVGAVCVGCLVLGAVSLNLDLMVRAVPLVGLVVAAVHVFDAVAFARLAGRPRKGGASRDPARGRLSAVTARRSRRSDR